MILRFILLFILASIVITIARIILTVFKISKKNSGSRNFRSSRGSRGDGEKDISNVATIIEERPLDEEDPKK